MGESWSDLDATEYLSEYGFIPVDGENPTAVGAYVTGEPKAGIRNYPLNHDPLQWRLLPASPGYHAGLEGKDLGADVDRVATPQPTAWGER